MQIVRTLLLWLSFAMLVFLEFFTTTGFRFGIIFRLVPSAMLLLWFILYTIGKQRYIIRPGISRFNIRLIFWIRNIANLLIIGGALLKLGHFSWAHYSLVAGIGSLALWSTLLILISVEKNHYDPEIIDDTSDDHAEDQS